MMVDLEIRRFLNVSLLLIVLLVGRTNQEPPTLKDGGRQCEYFSITEPSSNKTQVCDNKANIYCFAYWSTRKLSDNTTVAEVLKKGCFQLSYDLPDKEHPCRTECIQNYEIAFQSEKRNSTGFCCCSDHYCNQNFTMTKYIPTEDTPTQKPGVGNVLNTRVQIIIGCILLATSIFIILVTCYYCMHKRTKKNLHTYGKANLEEKEPQMCTVDLSHLEFEEIIGQGRYGIVWKATLHDKVVAVKVFSAENRLFWQAEIDFYKSLELKSSPNVLKFIEACEQPTDSSPNYLLLTEYHPQGSLRHYLHSNVINWKQMCLLGYTMASGLAFIHQEEGSRPAFAHRDFNSKNILVKQDGTCALADFGFAMKVPHEAKPVDDGTLITEVGTVRYMAPEVLDGAVNLQDIQGSLKQIDIYALALVLWELAMRCEDIFGKGQVPDYKLPFEAELGPMITSEAMHTFVVFKKLRPGFPDAWKNNHPGIRVLKETIEDCWDQDGDARLLALCVKDRIPDLFNQCPGTNSDNVSVSNVQEFQQNVMFDSPDIDKNTVVVTIDKDKDQNLNATIV